MSTPSSTNKSAAFKESLKRFSMGDNNPPPRMGDLPPSTESAPRSPASASSRSFRQRTASPNGRASSRPPRSPSSMSIDARSPTPSLLRKASMNSLHGVGGVTPPRPSSRRSSSSQFLNGSTMLGASKSPLAEIEPERPRHTAASIAHGHFEKDLALHEKGESSRQAETIVVLHDACYGHRYSRPRTSKAALGTIVERPERIQASVLGLSVAYVRLGERHAEGSNPLHPNRDPSSIPGTPFRIRKTTRRLPLSSQAVTNVHGTKWMEELNIMCDNAEAKLAMNGKELTRPEMTRSPTQDAPAKLHEGDLYLCSESLIAMEGALGAVCEGVDSVFQGAASGSGPYRTFVAIRPPGHHCSASYPSGFCWLNNVHVGISHAALTHGLTHAAIIDFDLHHGDGSQAIAWEHNKRATSLPKNALPWKKTSIGYFSLHDINSYPCEMGDEEKVKNASLCIENAHGQSIWNVHLQPWKSENDFWELYETKYSILLEKTRNYLRAQTERLQASPNGPRPKAAIFLSAGFDASEWESSGMQRHKVNVPTEFYARLTRDVVKLAAEEGTSVEGRIISVLEGGYSDRALYSGVLSHLSGLAGGAPVVIKQESNDLGHEIGQKFGSLSNFEVSEPVVDQVPLYDPLWWSSQRLEQLDAIVNPAAPPPEPKKAKDGTPPTYSTPTQSFIAKVASPRRVVSMGNSSPRPVVSRPPSPPPPEVDWTVAAHELSKLLIPLDRQTMSCRPEDLSAEATRARRDRQSILIPPTSGSEPSEITNQNTRMALRTRKPAKPIVETEEEDDGRKPAPKANRRKTVAGSAVIAGKAPSRGTTPMPTYAKPTSQSSRRLSLVSNAGSVTSEINGFSRAPSNGPTNMSQRPVTSQSVRPDSSMSSRGNSAPPVVVKKTRAPPQPRKDAPKPARGRRKSPVNISAGDSSTRSVSHGQQSMSSNVVLPSIETATSPPSDMDSLTSGMKKIKLSLTTKAQREAKEQGKTATKTSTKSAAPKTTKPRPILPPASQIIPAPPSIVPPTSNSTTAQPPVYPAPNRNMLPPLTTKPLSSNGQVSQPPIESLPPRPSTPQHSLQHVFLHQVQQPTNIPLPNSSPLNSPPKTPIQSGSVAAGSDIFVPYQPEGPTPHPVSQQEPIRWLSPNTATPTHMKRGDLPVFTSTSAIPFGVNPKFGVPGGPPEKAETMKKEDMRGGRDDSIWDVPETPPRM
ncbi:Histone deacetylase [Lachnellula occidentalis]|uniref:Histone deacetylase n=1 Tax=Lachnellula occidentalis TaxID=215460 RepID=A0A8H8S2U4_9HELO|nr:Histone deacetylase [Lachnellula occidentalis]